MPSSIRKIILIVALIYLGCSAFIFRGVIASIPEVVKGESVINADELVPFFDVHTELLDQVAGKFNQLTNGYEFRVRYSILTTWMRYYPILPFAIVLVIPATAFATFLAIAWLLRKVLTQFRPEVIYGLTAAPVLMIYLILTYSKITQFYTLIVGFGMFVVAAAMMADGLLLGERRPYRPIIAACLITLLNPAVHYLVLFGLFMALSVAALVVMDGWNALQNDSWRAIYRPRSWVQGAKRLWKDWRRLFVEVRFWRCVGAFAILGVVTLLPYYLWVTKYVLRGMGDLAETVPADYYFIQDASMTLVHILSLDLPGIMDKVLTGDYLMRVPRWLNSLYMLLMFVPLLVKRARRELFSSPQQRTFAAVIYVNMLFSMWAGLGYSDPAWTPTFHRTAAFISNYANGTQSFAGGLVVKLLGTVVQILRFPHRFELLTFGMACILLPVGWLWSYSALFGSQRFSSGYGLITQIAKMGKNLLQRSHSRENATKKPFPIGKPLGLIILLSVVFFVPLFSNSSYRNVLVSGNLDNFLAAYPVGPLAQVKQALLQLPQGKTIVLPPVETGKPDLDINGVEHKFIDKFYLYYLDMPGYYYGLTGDAGNKNQFFLLLRALYYQQSWWVNIARDLDIHYIVVNKGLIASTTGGQEYLRGLESMLIPEFDQHSAYLTKLMENESFVLYEFTDLPEAQRIPLYLDTDWNSFIRILSANPELTRYYDLRYPEVSGDLENYERLSLVTDDVRSAALDLYVKANAKSFFSPSSTIMPFNPNLISSNYYLSPMYRLFQFFSDSKFNRLNMITPGLWGTLEGGFIGVPQPTSFQIDIQLPSDGQYHLLLRGAASANNVQLSSRLLTGPEDFVLRSDDKNLTFFDKSLAFSSQRTPLDMSSYSLLETSKLIPTDVVVINYKYQYFDLGTVTGKKGTYTLVFKKQDASPLLVEGILSMPEKSYQTLSLPSNVELVPSANLCCQPIIIQGAMP